MKRLLAILALCLVGAPALAQQADLNIYKPATGTQFQGLLPTVAQQITTAIRANIRAVRIVCSVACFWAERLSGSNIIATTATGVFMPANIPEIYRVSPNSTISAIAQATSGTIYILELTR